MRKERLRASLRGHSTFKYSETRDTKGEVVSILENSMFHVPMTSETRRAALNAIRRETELDVEIPEVFSLKSFDAIRNPAHASTTPSTTSNSSSPVTAFATAANPKVTIQFVPMCPIRGVFDTWRCRVVAEKKGGGTVSPFSPPSSSSTSSSSATSTIVVSTLGFPFVCRYFEYRVSGVFVRDSRMNSTVFRADVATGIGMKRLEWNAEILGDMMRACLPSSSSSSPTNSATAFSSAPVAASAIHMQKYPTFASYRPVYNASLKTHADAETVRELDVWVNASHFLEKYVASGFSNTIFHDATVPFIRHTNYERLVARRWDVPFDVDYLVRRGEISQVARDFHAKMRRAGSMKKPERFTLDEIKLGIQQKVFSPECVHGKHHVALAAEIFKCLELIRADISAVSTTTLGRRGAIWEAYDCSGEKACTTPSDRKAFIRRWGRIHLKEEGNPEWYREYHRASFDWWMTAPSEYIANGLMPRDAPNSVEIAAANNSGSSDHADKKQKPHHHHPYVLFFFDAHLVAAHKLWQVLNTTMRHYDKIECVVLVGSNRYRRAAHEILGYRFYSALDYTFESKRLPLFPHIESAHISKWSKLLDEGEGKSTTTSQDEEDENDESHFMEYDPNLTRASLTATRRRRAVVCFPLFTSTRDFITAIRRIATESMRVAFINHKHDAYHSPPTTIHLFNQTTFIPDEESPADPDMNARALAGFENRLKRAEAKRIGDDVYEESIRRRMGASSFGEDGDDDMEKEEEDEEEMENIDPEFHYGMKRGVYAHRITWRNTGDSSPRWCYERTRGVEKLAIEDVCDPDRFVGPIPNVIVLCADAMTKDNHVRFAYEACDTALILVGIPLDRAKRILLHRAKSDAE